MTRYQGEDQLAVVEQQSVENIGATEIFLDNFSSKWTVIVMDYIFGPDQDFGRTPIFAGIMEISLQQTKAGVVFSVSNHLAGQ